MEKEPQPLPEVVCLVFFKDGGLLLEQRLKDDNFYRRWTFTGGKVDYGETREQASIREAEEETGLIPRAFQHLVSFEETSRNGGQYLFHGVLITIWQGKVQNKEPDKRNLSWVPLEKAADYIGDTEVDKKVLEKFLEFLNSS